MLKPDARDGKIVSASPGVPSADAAKPVRQDLQPVICLSGWDFSLSEIRDNNLFPSIYSTGWARGWVGDATCRLMDRHPKVEQGFNALKNGILGDGGRWIPNINPYGPRKSEWKLSLKYYNFLEYNYRQMQGSKWETDREMLDCIKEGNKIAAITTRKETFGPYKGKHVLDTIIVWANGTYELHRDENGKFTKIKVLGRKPGEQEIFPKEKWAHLAWRPVNGNPYGSRLYAAAYAPFKEDVQTEFEENCYMAQWGRPSVIIFAAVPPEGEVEEEMELYYADGKEVMEANPDYDPTVPGSKPQRHAKGYITRQNGILFTDFQSGSIWSMQGGSKVQVVQAAQGGEKLFIEKRREAKALIMDVILGTRDATEGGQSGVSSAGADLTEGFAGLNVTEGRVMLELMDERQIGPMLLLLNYGPAALQYMPIRDYGSGQNGRLPKVMNAQVGFASNRTMTRAQWWDFCASNSMALPWPDDEPASRAQAKETGGGDKTSKGKEGKAPKTRGDKNA